MIFSSSFFLLWFLPIFLLVYSIVAKEYKNYTILLASILFYAWGAPKFVFVILASTILDFYIVKAIFVSKEINKRKLFLFISLSLNLGLLLYFKYANFFIENVSNLFVQFGFENIKWINIVLPIGISFYTFQTLTYSIDVYKKVHKPLEKVTDYLLYIMSFPQMIAGPIVRFNSIADQILSREEKIDDKLIGFYRFSIGLAKKVLIANVMGEQADLIMGGDLLLLNSTQAWIGILAYTFQIYYDFSGYSDMAIGLGKMMGFTFPENFDSPYTATSITDFWKKWHITLGAFMRDYLYIPLGGNRVSSKKRLYFNLWVVFLLSGFWHGASWNFLMWGAYHGLFLILDRIFLAKILKKTGKFTSMFFTFFLVMMGWVVFRLENTKEIALYFNKLFDFDFNKGLEVIPTFYFILCLAILFSFSSSFKIGKVAEEFFYYKKEYSYKLHLIFTIISILFFVLSISSITASGFNPFIYFRF